MSTLASKKPLRPSARYGTASFFKDGLEAFKVRRLRRPRPGNIAPCLGSVVPDGSSLQELTPLILRKMRAYDVPSYVETCPEAPDPQNSKLLREIGLEPIDTYVSRAVQVETGNSKLPTTQ